MGQKKDFKYFMQREMNLGLYQSIHIFWDATVSIFFPL